MDYLGVRANVIVWLGFKASGFYSKSKLADFIEQYGRTTRKQATDQSNVMWNYWEGNPNPDAVKRPGARFFEYIVWGLINKPQEIEPYGDFGEGAYEVYVVDEATLDEILDTSPEFTPIVPAGVNWDTESIWSAFDYLIGIPSAISRFVYLDGDTWTLYLGSSGSPIPGVEPDPYTGIITDDGADA